MVNALITAAVRSRFLVTSREAATAAFARSAEGYARMAAAISDDEGRRRVRVPAMPGVDPEMRDWSFFMILEHNVLVNRHIASLVRVLARDEPPVNLAAFDPRRDVLPREDAGREQVAAFAASVQDYLDSVPDPGAMRGRRTHPHPIFGPFNVHQWHCVLGFHLQLHERQARAVVRRLGDSTRS